MTLSDITHLSGYVGSAKPLAAISGLTANTLGAQVGGGVTTSSTWSVGDCVIIYFIGPDNGYFEADAEL